MSGVVLQAASPATAAQRFCRRFAVQATAPLDLMVRPEHVSPSNSATDAALDSAFGVSATSPVSGRLARHLNIHFNILGRVRNVAGKY